MCVVGGGSCEKLIFQPYRKRRRGYLRDKNTKKKEHSEIKQFGNNNNSVPKSKVEKGEVLRWSLRKKNPAAHTVPT